MKKLIIATIVLASSNAFSQVIVSERIKAYCHAEKIAINHLITARTFFNDKLRGYDCLNVEIDAKIIKKVQTRFFSNNIPGELQIDIKTQCSETGMTRVRFAIDGFGYDEDYTEIDLEVTKNGKKYTDQICAYGIGGEVRNCRGHYDEPRNFSRKI